VPNPMIKKDVKRGYGSKEKLERKWDEAKDIAKKGHADEPWALTNFIYQRKKKAKSSVLDKVDLNAARRLIASERK
jgi:hypothetical protein